MISSTFFDLKQVRADLDSLIRELGCVPLISELPSFPIDPDQDTIENCRRRVEQDADILILIIGGRYGFVDSGSAKSITNIEYLAARAKGIPIYSFVDRKILTILPIWKANKDADFSNAVDDYRIFEFLEEIREQNKLWMWEFDLAKDIATVMRLQLAHLTLQGAQLVQRARDEREIAVLSQLRGRSLRIALEKPLGWKYNFFAEILAQETKIQQVLADQHRLGIAYGQFQFIDETNLRQWYRSRMAELESLIHSFGKLINEELHHAWQDESGSAELLLRSAKSIATLYGEALEWTLRVKRCVGEKEVTLLAEAFTHAADDIVHQLKELGFTVRKEAQELGEALRRGESGKKTLQLVLTVPGLEKINEALKNLIQRLIDVKQAESSQKQLPTLPTKVGLP